MIRRALFSSEKPGPRGELGSVSVQRSRRRWKDAEKRGNITLFLSIPLVLFPISFSVFSPPCLYHLARFEPWDKNVTHTRFILVPWQGASVVSSSSPRFCVLLIVFSYMQRRDWGRRTTVGRGCALLLVISNRYARSTLSHLGSKLSYRALVSHVRLFVFASASPPCVCLCVCVHVELLLLHNSWRRRRRRRLSACWLLVSRPWNLRRVLLRKWEPDSKRDRFSPLWRKKCRDFLNRLCRACQSLRFSLQLAHVNSDLCIHLCRAVFFKTIPVSLKVEVIFNAEALDVFRSLWFSFLFRHRLLNHPSAWRKKCDYHGVQWETSVLIQFAQLSAGFLNR